MIKDLQLLNYRENRVIIFSVTGFLLIYVFSSIGMYDPAGIDTLQDMMELLPAGVVRFLGFDNIGGSLTTYLVNYLYGFLMLLFPMIYTIMVSNKLVAKHTDSGSMIYLLTMPYSRRKIMFNQALFLFAGLFFIIGVNVIVMLAFSQIMFPGMLEIGVVLIVNLVTFGVHLILAGIAFLFSCLFSDSQKTVGAASIVLGLSAVLFMVSNLGEATEIIKYFSLFSFIDTTYLLEGGGNGIVRGILLVTAGVGVFAISLEIFNRKSIII